MINALAMVLAWVAFPFVLWRRRRDAKRLRESVVSITVVSFNGRSDCTAVVVWGDGSERTYFSETPPLDWTWINKATYADVNASFGARLTSAFETARLDHMFGKARVES